MATPEVTPKIREQFQKIKRRRRIRWAAGIAGFLVIMLFFREALDMVGFTVGQLIEQWPHFEGALDQYFPRTWHYGVIPFIDVAQYWEFIRARGLFRQAGITVAIGFAGTIMGLPFALLLSVLGSGRVTPFPFNFLFRGIMSSIRAIPALVWALIFVPLGGIGPFTATLAVSVDSIGNLGRLFTDELEEIEDGPIEAIKTTGAGRTQEITFGMLSQVINPFIAWTLYIFEINIRIAVGLGIIGAGGLGHVLMTQQRLFQYTNMMATVLVILVLIISIEMFSQRLRAHLRADEEPMSFIELLKGFPERMVRSLAK